MQNFPRLAKLFGCQLDKLDEPAIRAAIAARIPEGDDLDFKQAHHDEPDELAKDVAAFANSRGGLLVLGVAEDDGCASFAKPVDISDQIQRHIQQVMASRIHPFVHGVELRAIPTPQAGHGFLLLIVPASSQAPHAVVEPGSDGSLRYPVRAGTTTRWLSEHELSVRYADRFQSKSAASTRLDEIHTEGLARIAGWRSPWLAVSVAPLVLGSRGVGSERLAAEIGFTHSVWAPIATSPFRNGQAVSGRLVAGRARAILTEHIGYAGRSEHPHAELYYNGAGFAATDRDHKLANDGALVAAGKDPSADAILQDALEVQLLALLWMLAQHAADTGAAGELLVRAHQLPRQQTGSGRVVTPAQMWEPTSFAADDNWNVYTIADGSFLMPHQTQPVDTTVFLDELVGNERRTVQVAYDIAADLLGDFGVPEPMILRPDGELNVRRLHTSRKDAITAWAEPLGLAAPPTV
ncbi:AlbA family DNA-binding domain-containing protein [Mycolicibacterium helvum]|uniref:Schlafen AlbA-2 domain-containing protein n=1 Tax=Mycolicibacterium helvum TaxID=1534349 RepID=A0A7I7TCR7_9MYCO|nr:ATP-binding protein [Mycolicibacterium helvum]BBY66820.1 hypothetical protein MHEL_50630 [Mycolicibacterium helvum]